jgi:hypothetical protein
MTTTHERMRIAKTHVSSELHASVMASFRAGILCVRVFARPSAAARHLDEEHVRAVRARCQAQLARSKHLRPVVRGQLHVGAVRAPTRASPSHASRYACRPAASGKVSTAPGDSSVT